jgi:hypothetical protein
MQHPDVASLHPDHDPTPIDAIVVETADQDLSGADGLRGLLVSARSCFVHHSKFRLLMSPSGQERPVRGVRTISALHSESDLRAAITQRQP